jgi:hypothetical protein
MCCFSQPVLNVSNTSIFARIVNGGWQYLVYQMQFESKELNAMILPLPVSLPAGEGDTVTFVSLEKHKRFFRELDSGFPLRRPRSRSNDLKDDSLAVDSAALLEVHQVGDFVASFVPTVGDFDRLDPQFRIAKNLWDKIPGYGDFGFAVFQLKEKKGQPHPMAFKFRSRLATGDRRQVFFPTVHIHDGEVHAREEFDHMLYLQSPEFDAVCGDYYEQPQHVADPRTGYVRSKWPAKEFCNIRDSRGILQGDALVHRLQMRGKHLNRDVLAKLDFEQDTKTSMNIPLNAPACAGAAGFAWLIDRRDKLAGRGEDDS